MYYNNAEWIFSMLYPHLEWSVKTSAKEIYLTFDDGPVPEITDFVLEQLKSFSASATFFMVGDNISKNPNLFKKVLAAGHRIGNHTFNHLRGWGTEDHIYLENIEKCRLEMEKYGTSPGRPLFRPPYGKVKKSQIRALKSYYRIIMWNVLTGDFDPDLSPETCLTKALKYTGKGSIVIFHDSLKAEKNMRYVLPRFLEHFAEKGFTFKSL